MRIKLLDRIKWKYIKHLEKQNRTRQEFLDKHSCFFDETLIKKTMNSIEKTEIAINEFKGKMKEKEVE